MQTKVDRRKSEALAYRSDGDLTAKESVLLLGAFIALIASMASLVTL